MSSNTGATSSVHNLRVHRVTDASVESRNSIATTFSTLPSAHAAIIVLTQLFFAVLASGVGLRDAAIVTLATIPIVGGGAAIFAFFTKTNQLSFASLIGGGIAVGTMLPALSSFAIGELGYRGLIDDYALLIGFALLATRTFIGRTPRVAVDPAPVSLLLLAFGVAVFGYYGWGPFVWPFLLGSALAAAIGFVAIRLATTRTSPLQPARAWTYVLLAIPAIGWITQATIDHRLQLPRSYLFTASYTDNLFDEALAFSTSRWGYNENPFFVGHDVVGYLLTNSWAGSLTDSLDVAPFVILSSFSQFLALLGILFLSFSLAESLFKNRISALLAILLVGLQGSFGELLPFTEPPRVQHSVSLLWVILGMSLLWSFHIRALRWPFVILTISFTATTLGKPQMALYFVIATGVVGLFEFLRGPKRMLTIFEFGVVLTIFAVLSRMLSNMYFGEGIGQWGFFFDQSTLSEWLIPALVALLFRNHIPWNLRGGVETHSRLFLTSLLFAGLSIALVYALSHNANLLRHSFTVALVIGSIVASDAVRRVIELQPRLVIALLVLIGSIFGIVTYYYEQLTVSVWLPETDLRRRISFDHPTLSQIIFVTIGTLLTSVLLITMRLANKNRWLELRKTASVAISVLVLLIVGSNAGVYMAWTTRHQLREVIYQQNDLPATDFGPREDPRILPTDWIRSATTPDVIVAHNAMCTYLPEVGVSPPGEMSPDCAFRSTSSWVSAFSHRRAYLDRPLNALIRDADLAEANLRYRNSVLFAAEALPSAMEDFERVGVGYFVVDLSQTELRSWEPYATVVYRDDFYLVLQLNY